MILKMQFYQIETTKYFNYKTVQGGNLECNLFIICILVTNQYRLIKKIIKKLL